MEAIRTYARAANEPTSKQPHSTTKRPPCTNTMPNESTLLYVFSSWAIIPACVVFRVFSFVLCPWRRKSGLRSVCFCPDSEAFSPSPHPPPPRPMEPLRTNLWAPNHGTCLGRGDRHPARRAPGAGPLKRRATKDSARGRRRRRGGQKRRGGGKGLRQQQREQRHKQQQAGGQSECTVVSRTSARHAKHCALDPCSCPFVRLSPTHPRCVLSSKKRETGSNG